MSLIRIMRSPAYPALAGFLVMVVPALVFAARLSSIAGVQWAFLLMAVACGLIGTAGFAALPFAPTWRRKPSVSIAMLFLLSTVVCLGGLILVLLPDPSVFLATLVSAAFSIIVIWYEKILSGRPTADRRLASPSARKQKGPRRRRS